MQQEYLCEKVTANYKEIPGWGFRYTFQAL